MTLSYKNIKAVVVPFKFSNVNIREA